MKTILPIVEVQGGLRRTLAGTQAFGAETCNNQTLLTSLWSFETAQTIAPVPSLPHANPAASATTIGHRPRGGSSDWSLGVPGCSL